MLGAVRPFGFLVAVSTDRIVTRASANAPDWLGRPVEALLGAPILSVLAGEAVHLLRGHLQTLCGPDAVDRVFGVRLPAQGPHFDVALHMSGASVAIEAQMFSWIPESREREVEAAQEARSREVHSRRAPAPTACG